MKSTLLDASEAQILVQCVYVASEIKEIYIMQIWGNNILLCSKTAHEM